MATPTTPATRPATTPTASAATPPIIRRPSTSARTRLPRRSTTLSPPASSAPTAWRSCATPSPSGPVASGTSRPPASRHCASRSTTSPAGRTDSSLNSKPPTPPTAPSATGSAAASTLSKPNALTRPLSSQNWRRFWPASPNPTSTCSTRYRFLKTVNITEAPERLQRKLYEALQLQIHYDRPDHARFRLTVTDDTVDIVDALTRATTGTGVRQPETRAHATAAPPGAPPAIRNNKALSCGNAARGFSLVSGLSPGLSGHDRPSVPNTCRRFHAPPAEDDRLLPTCLAHERRSCCAYERRFELQHEFGTMAARYGQPSVACCAGSLSWWWCERSGRAVRTLSAARSQWTS
jgi:hypothetical protein